MSKENIEEVRNFFDAFNTGKLSVIERMVEGKIVEHWSAPDNLGMFQQLGLVPMPGQAR